MKRKTLWATALLALVAAASVGASLFLVPSNIDPAHKFSWSENAGWMNWLDANSGADGVFVDSDLLSGYVWMENAGWVNVGNGGGPYANTNDTNFGVNILGNGNLAGYAWGENIGWINFDTSSNAPNQARFDAGAGRLRGYAWGENIGWINLDDSTHFVATMTSPPQIVWNVDENAATRHTRFLTFSVQPPATATGSGGDAAIAVTMVELQRPDPRNSPANKPPNFSGFDTNVNGLCSGGDYNGHPCMTNDRCLRATPMGTDGTCNANTGCTMDGAGGNCTRWVGAVQRFLEAQDSPALGDYYGARLQCSPYYAEFTVYPEIGVFGAEIVPSSTYEVTAYSSSCKGAESSCPNVSTPVTMLTRRAGDATRDYNPPTPTPQPDGNDVGGVVNKFKKAQGSPSNRSALLQPNVPDPGGDVGANDIGGTVDAFKGAAYAFSGPCVCPSTVACSAVPPCPAGSSQVSTCNGGPNAGRLCSGIKGCNYCSGGTFDGLPCDPTTPAAQNPCLQQGGTCPPQGTCTTAVCRDRCGRCD